ncbi:MAG TPA: hypothetical protein VGN26_08315 [Armatimonadota bacterium]
MTALPDANEAMNRLSPEDYRQILQETHLDLIALDALDARVDRRAWLQGEGQVEADLKREWSVVRDRPDAAALVATWVLRASIAGKVGARVKATYRLALSSRSPVELSDDFLAIYASLSGDRQIWPYLRELTSSVGSKLGVPAPTLPMLVDHQEIGGGAPRSASKKAAKLGP